MKKITLFLVAFVFVFGFFINNVRAESYGTSGAYYTGGSSELLCPNGKTVASNCTTLPVGVSTAGTNPIEISRIACSSFPCFFDGKAITNTWSTVDSSPTKVSAKYPYEFSLKQATNVQMVLRSNVWPSTKDDGHKNIMYVELDKKVVFKESKSFEQYNADEASDNTIDTIQLGKLSAGKHYIKIYAYPDPEHFMFDWFKLESSGTVSAVSAPVISGVSGPQSLNTSEQGTWKVSAYYKNGNDLYYYVTWGDEETGSHVSAASAQILRPSQTATFTHKYSKDGTYTPTFTVISPNTIRCVQAPCPSNGGSAQTSLSVNVGSVVSTSSITVLSPNGGESWKTGTTQTIKWKDTSPMPTCVADLPCIDPFVYDVSFDSNSVAYEIANDVRGFSYRWNISGIPAGVGKIRVCRSDGSYCDTSDSYFKITSTSSGANTAPVIVDYPAGQGSATVGYPLTLSWSAKDADNDNLAWSVNWGDAGPQASGACASTGDKHTGTGNNWYFSSSHTYRQAGKYIVTGYVNDCYGGSDSKSYTVYVDSVSMPNSVIVVSPNGGESWAMGSQQKIIWQDNFPTPACSSEAVNCYVEPQLPKYYDVILEDLSSCYKESCSTFALAYTVKSPYYWTVGKYDGDVRSISGGSYRMKVCQAGTSVCDTSDNYFKITSSITVVNTPPEITTNKIPADIVANVTTPFLWAAKDADNDNLSWSVDWGDEGPQMSGVCSSTNGIHTGTGLGWTYNTSHTYLKSGTYVVVVYVNDCYGGSDSRKFFVTVAEGTGTSPVEIILGDVNADGRVTCADNQMILDAVSGRITLTADQKTRADMNKSGRITTYDSSLLLQKYKLSCTLSIPVSSASSVLGEEVFTFTQRLQRGSQGEEVAELQKVLSNLGYYYGVADGKFGAKTQSAIVKFQNANNLADDGVVGAKVRELLNK
ncbi:MAG: peptidoglycan-binding protein [Candidatus Paceibacterota bacterium]